MGGGCGEVDPDLAKRLAEHYAPECRFDSREKYFPCGIDWLASNSSLQYKTWWNKKLASGVGPEAAELVSKQHQDKDDNKTWAVIDQQILGFGELTDPGTVNEAVAAAMAADEKKRQSGALIKSQHRLEPHPEKWEGQSELEMENGEVPCYYSVVPAPTDVYDDDLDHCINNVCDDVYQITYYMIYAYNGNIFAPFGLCKPVQVGTHSGDLEQIVVYAKDPNTLTEGDNGLVATFQYRHAGEGRFVEEPELVVFFEEEGEGGTHCVVYPAAESHASYDKPSWTLRILGWANDLHNGQGRVWQTWKNLIAINKSKGEPKWIQYEGRYGGVEGLATRSNLGRPGFCSRALSLPPYFPINPLRAKPETAPSQIPRKLTDAVQRKEQS